MTSSRIRSGFALFQRLQCALDPPQHLRLISMPAEVVVDERGEFGLVFDDGDSFGHGTQGAVCTIVALRVKESRPVLFAPFDSQL